MTSSLAEFEQLSRKAKSCFIVKPAGAGLGGVDPLGLRQINFDLMNDVFPGLNNVARYIRPFTLVTWAWRRTIALARKSGEALPVSSHEDFVARIEVAFVWSMLQNDEVDVDLPGKQVVWSRWGAEDKILFGDADWTAFVKARRNSTALTAAINYGPGLRAFRLLEDDSNYAGTRFPGEATAEMLDAFEARIKPLLRHALFRERGPCTLTRKTAKSWTATWDMEDLLEEEKRAMRERLMGARAPTKRRGGFELLTRAVDDQHEADEGEGELRPAMLELEDAKIAEPALHWNRVQMRQSFRLGLEALFEWIIAEIGGGTMTTEVLAAHMLERTPPEEGQTARPWLEALAATAVSPVEAMDALQANFPNGATFVPTALAAIALPMLANASLHDRSERRERLPIALAAADLDRIGNDSPQQFLKHMIENWLIAQHTYWSVGRGLADARAGAKKIMRLRLVLEPGGWRVTRGRGTRGMPRPTPDRLRTAISLAQQCDLI